MKSKINIETHRPCTRIPSETMEKLSAFPPRPEGERMAGRAKARSVCRAVFTVNHYLLTRTIPAFTKTRKLAEDFVDQTPEDIKLERR